MNQRKPFPRKKATAIALALTLLFVCFSGRSATGSGPDSLHFWMESWIPCDSGQVAAFERTTYGYAFLVNSTVGEKHVVRLIATDEQGQIRWNRLLGTDKNYIGCAVKPRYRGGFIVCGSAAAHLEAPDFWLAALDSTGETIWQKEWGGAGSQGLNAVSDNAGDLAIAGWAQNENSDDAEMYLAMTDARGMIRWSRTFGGLRTQQFFALCIGEGNTLAAAGQSAVEGRDETDIVLLKSDASGQTLWRQSYRLNESARVRTIQPTDDKGFIIATALDPERAGDCGAHVLKVDERGNPQWDQRYWLGANCCDGLTIKPDHDGYLIGAFAITCDTSYRDLQILRTDRLGEPLWWTFYSGAGYNRFKIKGGYWNCQTADPFVKGLRILFGESIGEFRLVVKDARLMGRNKDKWVSFVSFELPKMCPMRLMVADIHGRHVETVIEANCFPGRHSRWWDATNQPSGIYVARLETPTGTITQKFVVMK